MAGAFSVIHPIYRYGRVTAPEEPKPEEQKKEEAAEPQTPEVEEVTNIEKNKTKKGPRAKKS